jgi:hypothetical protein
MTVKLDADHQLVHELVGRTITAAVVAVEFGDIKSLVLTLDNGREVEMRGTDDYASDPSVVFEARVPGDISREFSSHSL